MDTCNIEMRKSRADTLCNMECVAIRHIETESPSPRIGKVFKIPIVFARCTKCGGYAHTDGYFYGLLARYRADALEFILIVNVDHCAIGNVCFKFVVLLVRAIEDDFRSEKSDFLCEPILKSRSDLNASTIPFHQHANRRECIRL